VARQLLTESLLLGAVGGAAGLLLAMWLVPWLASLLAGSPPEPASPHLLVYLVAALFTVFVAVAAGLAPARLAWRSDVTSAVKTDRLGAPGALSGGRLRALLVGTQAAASIVLLVVSALLVRSLLYVTTYNHGAHIDRLVNVTVLFGNADEARRANLLNAALARIGAMTGVAGVSRVTFPPFSSGASVGTAGRGTSRERAVYRNFVSSDYFGTIGARLLEGRVFTDDEVRGGAPVAVITRGLAREFWPDQTPIGSDLYRLWGADDGSDGSKTSWSRRPAGTRIIGVVEETTASPHLLGRPTLYLPVSATVEAREQLIVRVHADRDPEDLVTPIHEALRALDPGLSRRVDAMAVLYRDSLESRRTWALLASAVGLAALVLAVSGLFVVTAYAVAQRRHELSVRVALGATGPQVVRMILRRSLTPVAIGLACGLGASVFADRLVRSWLIDIQPHDPFAIGAAVSILLVAALAAAFIPARHAARVDPVEMLRQS
jgi:predicted permease